MFSAFAFGLWNIGVEGQVVAGAITATAILRLGTESGMPGTILGIAFMGGMLGGSLWAPLAGFLKVKGGVNEIFGGRRGRRQALLAAPNSNQTKWFSAGSPRKILSSGIIQGGLGMRHPKAWKMANTLTKKSLLLLLVSALFILAHSSCRPINMGKNAPNDHRDSTRSMTYKGRSRTYQIHVPPHHGRRVHLPLVIVLHGGGGTGQNMKRYLTRGGFDSLADEEGFVVVYPNGVERHWNDGRELHRYRAHREDVDDVGFISRLIDHHVATLRIDPRRVYVTGISNGGLMSYRLACQLTKKITAIASVTASLSEKLIATCRPTASVSVLIMNGTEDPLVPWDGGDIHIGRRTFGRVLSTRDTVRFWVERNRCSPSNPLVKVWDENQEDGTRVRREVYGECEDGGEVALYTIEGGGHTWPGGFQYLPEWVIGKTSLEINASETIWRFFETKKRGK